MSEPHSPLPWHLTSPVMRSGAHVSLTVEMESGASVTFLEQLEMNSQAHCFEDNARFIVQACNSHHGLLEALKGLRCSSCGYALSAPREGVGCATCRHAVAALAKASHV